MSHLSLSLSLSLSSDLVSIGATIYSFEQYEQEYVKQGFTTNLNQCIVFVSVAILYSEFSRLAYNSNHVDSINRSLKILCSVPRTQVMRSLNSLILAGKFSIIVMQALLTCAIVFDGTHSSVRTQQCTSHQVFQ